MKTAIMFSGQGAQFPGMMRDIFGAYPEALEAFERAKSIIKRDIYSLIMDASVEELNLTKNTQPCLLACELAALRVFRSCEISYGAALGFSLGEWAALVAAGAATEEDVFAVIEKRADAMQRAVPPGEGGMVVILGQDRESVLALCDSIGEIAPANYNCPGNITVAGTATAVKELLQQATEKGIMANEVAVSVPSHCKLMRPAADELEPLIRALPLMAPKISLVMNATGKFVTGSNEVKENLIRQLCEPVMFQPSIELLLDQGFDTFIEIGPGKTLSGMVKRTARQAKKKVDVLQFNSLEGVEAVKKLGKET